MLRHPLARAVLVLLPLAVCAGRVHRHVVATPGAVTQEVNRCLTMVRIAATRRSPAKPTRQLAIRAAGFSWEPRRLRTLAG